MPTSNEMIVYQKPKSTHGSANDENIGEDDEQWRNATFAWLPAELLIEVLLYLRPRKLLAVACCNKNLHEFILAGHSKPGQHLWKTLYLASFSFDHEGSVRIPWVLRYRQQIEHRGKRRKGVESISICDQKVWYAENVCSKKYTYYDESLSMDDHERQYTRKIVFGLNVVANKTCVLLKENPCVVLRAVRSVRYLFLEGVNIFTFEKVEDRHRYNPGLELLEVLVKFKMYELVDIEDPFAVLMLASDNSNDLMRSDLQIPNNQIGKEIASKFDNLAYGKVMMIKVMTALGSEAIVDYEIIDDE